MTMPNLIDFSRNRDTSVEHVDEETLRARCFLRDTLMEAEVEILVKLPDLNITEARGRIVRDERGIEVPLEDLGKAVGVRVGPGMAKILSGLIGEDFPCPQLIFMIEECCHGVILYFTKDELAQAPDDLEGARDFFAQMLRKSIRLYNRCAAFAPGSSITEGIEPPSAD